MNATNTVTVDQLIAEYAQPIAESVGFDPADYDPTIDGFTNLLSEVADGLGPMDQPREWLEEAAADLNAIALLGGDNKKTQKLLKRVDRTLYEAKSDLECC